MERPDERPEANECLCPQLKGCGERMARGIQIVQHTVLRGLRRATAAVRRALSEFTARDTANDLSASASVAPLTTDVLTVDLLLQPAPPTVVQINADPQGT